MSFHAYASFKGTKQGQLKGESLKDNKKDKWVSVLAFSYSVQAPRDASTGQASGKRQHKPIVITKAWGDASPQLLQAVWSNEILSSVEFQFAKPDASGKEVVYQTIKLTNATIVAFRTYHGALPPGSPPGGRYESLTLDYADESITGAGAAPSLLGEVRRFGNWA